MARTVLILCVCLILPLKPPLDAAESSKPLSAIEMLKRPLMQPAISGPLDKAFVQFRKLVDVRLEVDWPMLQLVGVRKTKRLSVKAPKATGEQLLDMMLAQAAGKGKPLAWYVDGGTVRVTTQMRVLQLRRLPMRLRRKEPIRPRPIRPRPKRFNEFDFDNLPLEDTIDHFRNISGLNLHVNWRSLELIGVERKTPVTIKASNISLGRALRLVTEQLSTSSSKLERVYWVLDEGVITIATGEALNMRLITKVYVVGDLLLVVPNFRASRISMDIQSSSSSSSSGSTGGNSSSQGGLFDQDDSEADEDDQSVGERRQQLRDSLIDIIINSIGQDMWRPIGPGSIRLLGDKLVITQTPLGFKLLAEAARPRGNTRNTSPARRQPGPSRATPSNRPANP